MQKLHIDEFYRKVVPDGTPDCEPNPGFNYDKASMLAERLQKVWKLGFCGQDPCRVQPASKLHLALPWRDLLGQLHPLHRHHLLWAGSPASSKIGKWQHNSEVSQFIQTLKTNDLKTCLTYYFKGLQDCRLLFWSYSCDQWTQQYKVHIICVFFIETIWFCPNYLVFPGWR